MDSPLKLNLSAIPEGISDLEVEVPSRELELESRDAEFIGPARIVLTVARQGEQLHVRGQAEIGIRQVCARCLQEAARELRASVSVVVRGRSERDPQEEAADGLLFHDGEAVDLTGEIREVLILEIPAAPLCRPDCAGLCPRCGADLNAGACGCGETVQADPRWAALRKLKQEDSRRKA